MEETDKTAIMSSGSTIQFRQSKIGHDSTAHKLKTRSSLTPAPGSGLSSQQTSSQEEGVGLPGKPGIVSGRQSNVSHVYKTLGIMLVRRAEPRDVGEVLRNFDLTSKYGPCLGLTRLERWAPASMRGNA